MNKRFLSSVIAAVMTAVIFLGNLSATRAEALLFTPNVTIQSEAAVLLNMEVGDIVYEKNADMKKMPGSLVQIMTAVIVLENCTDITSEKITTSTRP